MEQKLTETQIKMLDPIANGYNQAKANLDGAIMLIVGKPITSYNYSNGILTYEINEPKLKENV